MPKKSNDSLAAGTPAKGNTPAKKKRRFGFADVVIIVSVMCLGFVGWTVWYGANVQPVKGAEADLKACYAFLDGFERSHYELSQNNVTGYIDEFFKGNDAALELADTNGSLYQLLIQVGMQRMSVNYDMTGETVAAYLEPMAMQVHDTDACMAMPESSSAPTPSPTASN